jgi:hypothetical protein
MAGSLPSEVRAARRDVSRLVRERERLVRETADRGVVDHRLAEIDRTIAGRLDDVLHLVDPCDASATEPLVLLPVRLETRFGSDDGQATLRVRIYPDELHVDDLVRGLTADEVSAGTTYWTAMWAEPAPENAWTQLVDSVGMERAEWVAYATTPTNLDQRGPATAPSFAQAAPRGGRNVVARALPDRFVVLAVQGEQISEKVGNPIPPDLPLSPIPLEGDEATRVADALTLPPGSEWLVDFKRAVDVGMAVTVTLAGGAAPIDRVLALGTRASLTAGAAANELEDLLVGHRYRNALGVIPQGTPTNNADVERSPYRVRATPGPPPVVRPTARAGSDTSAAARLLGVDADVLTALVGDGTGEQAIAKAVNTALWAPGWGEYLNRLDEQGVPGVVDAQRESARELFRDHVRGRGPAPALRVRAQPYGLLPVSDLGTWKPAVGETTAGIVQVVRGLLKRWRFAAERNVPVIRPGGANIDATMLDVLGSSPTLQGLRVRPVITDDVSAAVISALGLDHREYEAEQMSTRAVVSELLLGDAAKIAIGSLHVETRPLPLPLASKRDPEFIAALLEAPSRVLSVDSVLQALLVLAWQSSELDVAKASPASVLPSLVDFVELEPHIKAQASAMLARGDEATPEELYAFVGQLQDAGVRSGGPSMLREYQPAEQIQTSLAEVALSAPVTAEARSVGAAALAGWFHAMGYRAEVRAAMQELAPTDVAARELAVAEALDCTSHRLDAWATAIVSQRHDRLASRAPRGLTIGAYGVVENLHPDPTPAANGWIYAPSPRHAAAAGMLRSSHLNHLPDAGTDGGPFAIDLSSGRVRAATHVLEGVRQGQQLGALIGYQIERALADAQLARLQLSLRTIAPLVARRLDDSDDADSRAAQESVAAVNVVDGVLLLKLHAPGDPALRSSLDQPPENAYLEPGDWEPLTDPEWSTVTQIMRTAAETIDAVADVMLSESVLQFAGGNPQRAAAAMDAMSTGASPSDTADILEAQDSGERLNHRVLAIIGTNSGTNGWNTSRPRAVAEPRLEAWAAAHLGDPSDIVVADTDERRITLDEAGFAALDLVHAADLVALERALRVAISDLGEAELAVTRGNGWPAKLRALGQVVGLAATLRILIAGAQPVLPLDLTRPGEKPTRDLQSAMPELTGRVTALAASLATAVAGLESTIATIPSDGIVGDTPTAETISRAAYALEPFGIQLEPILDRPLDVVWVRDAWEVAQARSLNANALATRLGALPAGTPAAIALDSAREVASAVLGDAFVVVPVLAAATKGDDFIEALGNPVFATPPSSAVRRFVRDVGTVRQQMTRFSETLLLGAALGHPRTPGIVQLSPRTEAGPAEGTTRWLAGPLPPEGPWPASSVAHVVLDQVGDVETETAIAGLVLDAWVEDLPAQPGPKADPDDPRPGRARTALALRSNSASARPPQAILSAISPGGNRWTTDSVRAVIEQTLELARARLVTLERLAGDGLVLPALYTRSSSLQGQQQFIEFEKLAQFGASFVAMPFVKELKK